MPITDCDCDAYDFQFEEGVHTLGDFAFMCTEHYLIGKGAYNKVFTCYNIYSLERFAIKVYPTKDAFLHEFHFFYKFQEDFEKHSCVVARSLAADLDKMGPYFGIVLDLFEYDIWKLTQKRQLHFSEGLLVVASIGGALHYLGQKCIVHGDVKTNNILISQSRVKVVLADFGNAVDCFAVTEGEMKAPRTLCTRYYRPPEIVGQNLAEASFLCSPAIDLFAFGASLWEVGVSVSCSFAPVVAARPVHREYLLFRDSDCIKEYARLIGGGKVLNGPWLERVHRCGDFAEMVLALTHPDPQERRKLVVEHPYFMDTFLPDCYKDVIEFVLRAP